MAVRTLMRVGAETWPTPLNTRETVAVETPAWVAMSAMLVRFFVIEALPSPSCETCNTNVTVPVLAENVTLM